MTELPSQPTWDEFRYYAIRELTRMGLLMEKMEQRLEAVERIHSEQAGKNKVIGAISGFIGAGIIESIRLLILRSK